MREETCRSSETSDTSFRTCVRPASRQTNCRAQASEDETEEQRRARLEELGRQAADEQAKLDSAGDDGGLMAEFNSRLDKEGGKELFALKTSASAVTESGKHVARKCPAASESTKVLQHQSSPRALNGRALYTASDAAKVAKDKAAGLADAASGLTSGLNEQQKNFGKIILGLIAFNLLIGAIGSALGGGGGYSV